MVKEVNKLFYVIRPKGGGLFCLTIEVCVKKEARNGMGLIVYNQNQMVIEVVQSNIASFSPGCRCGHPLKSVLDQKAVLTLTLEVRMLWCPVDQEDKTSCLRKLGGCGMLTFSLRNSCLGSTWQAP